MSLAVSNSQTRAGRLLVLFRLQNPQTGGALECAQRVLLPPEKDAFGMKAQPLPTVRAIDDHWRR